MSYQIQILSDKEFEELPYEEVGMSLGLADTNKNTAYVRYVANAELQKYLINHELEHLIGADRDEIHHDGKGVYYKGFGNVFSAVGSGLSNAASGITQGVGQLGSNLGQSIGGAASSIGQGISSLAGSASKAMGFGGGFQGGANPQGGMLAAGASNPALRAPMDYFKSAPGSSIQPFSMLQSGASAGALSPFGTNKLSQSPIMQAFNPGGGQFGGKGASGSWTPPATPKITPQAPQAPQAPADTSKMTQAPQQPQAQGGKGFDLMGGLSKGLGMGQQIMSMFSGSQSGMQGGYPSGIQMPDVSQLPSVQAVKNFNFRDNMMEMDPALQDAINRDFDKIDAQELHDFRNRWKNIRPGADIENDSVFARDYQALQDSQATRRADALAQNRKEMITTNLAISDREYQQLDALADMDIQTIMFNTAMSYDEAMKLKQMYGKSTETSSITQSELPRDEGGALGAVGNMIQQGRGIYDQAKSFF